MTHTIGDANKKTYPIWEKGQVLKTFWSFESTKWSTKDNGSWIKTH